MQAPEYAGRSHKIVNTSVNAVEGIIAVKLNDNSTPDFSSIKGIKHVEKVFTSTKGKEKLEQKYGLDKWYAVETENKVSLDSIADALAKISNVKTIQFGTRLKKASDCKVVPYDKVVTKAQTKSWAPFDDPMATEQWHYFNSGDKSVAPTAKAGADINVKPAWKFCTGDPSIVVAVIDEGVYYEHPDLANNIWTNPKETPDFNDDLHGYNFVSDGRINWGLEGDSGHGTHIAGTIAAVNNNGIGVCGIAGGDSQTPGVKIMSCQIFEGGQGGTSIMSSRAFKYAADNGACIAQCSWGYDSGTFRNDAEYKYACPMEVDAMEYFLDPENSNHPNLVGNICIFASGNEGQPLPGYPAGYYKNIAVNSIASDNLPAYYTNYGKGTNITAPGGEYYTGGQQSEAGAILSTLPLENARSGYGYMQGTSMACPHVTGIAALGIAYMKQQGIKMTNQEFITKLLTSVNDIDNLLTGSKLTLVGNSIGSLQMAPYRKNMGTGTIDTWRFFMQIDGTPCLVAKVGESQRLDLSDYFGGCSKNLTYLEVNISDEDKTSLGLEKDPVISYGKLSIHPTKTGCGIVRIRAVAGGDSLGTGGADLGGIALDREIAIIARPVKSTNGGWL